MFYDNTKIWLPTYDDNLCYKFLTPTASYPSGWRTYEIKHKNRIAVKVNEETKQVKLNANLPYFFNGHNFKPTRNDIVQAVDNLSDAINIDLMKSYFDEFEFGCILEVEDDISSILLNHNRAKGRNYQPYYIKGQITGIDYSDNISNLKIYDASLNFKNKLPKEVRKEMEENFGYNPSANYIKIEMRYKKPERHFQQSNLTFATALEMTFMEQCKKELIDEYSMINKTMSIKKPTKKSDLSTEMILLSALYEIAEQTGKNVDDILYAKLNQNKGILSIYDMKYRRQHIKALSKKIFVDDESQYDLIHKLESSNII